MRIRIIIALAIAAFWFPACAGVEGTTNSNAWLDWSLKTLVTDYEQNGQKNPKWDTAAKTGLRAFAQMRCARPPDNPARYDAALTTNILTAVSNGCNDPVVKYLYARVSTNMSAEERTQLYKEVAEKLAPTRRPEIRKFYACLRAAQALYTGWPAPPVFNQLYREAISHLHNALEDKTLPVPEVSDACQEVIGLHEKYAALPEAGFKTIEGPLLMNWSNQAIAHLFRGEYYIAHAWVARTGKYASQVPDSAWKVFADRLDEAEKALTRAWELDPKNPRTAQEMMRLETGQGKGRERMEKWFARAMALDTNYYNACTIKLYYLEPKWYGSAEDMLEFGHQCVGSKAWGGEVPLILADAHFSLSAYTKGTEGQKQYWKQPEVWGDVKSSFERFFKLNPEAIGYRHNYARYAYWCEQWDELNKQLKLFGPTNYTYFGGKEDFERMAKLAAQHGGR